jgi:hypothetical protein
LTAKGWTFTRDAGEFYEGEVVRAISDSSCWYFYSMQEWNKVSAKKRASMAERGLRLRVSTVPASEQLAATSVTPTSKTAESDEQKSDWDAA